MKKQPTCKSKNLERLSEHWRTTAQNHLLYFLLGGNLVKKKKKNTQNPPQKKTRACSRPLHTTNKIFILHNKKKKIVNTLNRDHPIFLIFFNPRNLTVSILCKKLRNWKILKQNQISNFTFFPLPIHTEAGDYQSKLFLKSKT